MFLSKYAVFYHKKLGFIKKQESSRLLSSLELKPDFSKTTLTPLKIQN